MVQTDDGGRSPVGTCRAALAVCTMDGTLQRNCYVDDGVRMEQIGIGVTGCGGKGMGMVHVSPYWTNVGLAEPSK